MAIDVLVPGYGGPGRFVERWRMSVAERTLAAHGGGVLVASGHRGEAERLSNLASPGVCVRVEPTAASTEENIERSLLLFSRAGSVAIATDRVHRRRAEKILRQLDPSLGDQLVAPEYSVRDGFVMDMAGAVYEVARRVRRAAKTRLKPAT